MFISALLSLYSVYSLYSKVKTITTIKTTINEQKTTIKSTYEYLSYVLSFNQIKEGFFKLTGY
jgi:CHASE3 domain sensor protein